MIRYRDFGIAARFRAAPRALFWGWAITLALVLTVLGIAHALPLSFLPIAAGLLLLIVWSPGTQRFVAGATPFLAQGAVYELMGVLKPWLASRSVHIAGPYTLERTLFGIPTKGGVRTLNEILASHHWPAIDLITGGSYILYIYQVLALLLFLSYTRHRPGRGALFRRFGGAFFAMSLAGYVAYQLFPAAPPWYVSLHGFAVDLSVQANPAGALRWDQLTGIPYFQHFYGLTTNVFGAIPSLHVAYAVIVCIYAYELQKLWLRVISILQCLLMGFAAVYLQHHYVLDVLAGAFLAVVVWASERIASALLARRLVAATETS